MNKTNVNNHLSYVEKTNLIYLLEAIAPNTPHEYLIDIERSARSTKHAVYRLHQQRHPNFCSHRNNKTCPVGNFGSGSLYECALSVNNMRAVEYKKGMTTQTDRHVQFKKMEIDSSDAEGKESREFQRREDNNNNNSDDSLSNYPSTLQESSSVNLSILPSSSLSKGSWVTSCNSLVYAHTDPYSFTREQVVTRQVFLNALEMSYSRRWLFGHLTHRWAITSGHLGTTQHTALSVKSNKKTKRIEDNTNVNNESNYMYDDDNINSNPRRLKCTQRIYPQSDGNRFSRAALRTILDGAPEETQDIFTNKEYDTTVLPIILDTSKYDVGLFWSQDIEQGSDGNSDVAATSSPQFTSNIPFGSGANETHVLNKCKFQLPSSPTQRYRKKQKNITDTGGFGNYGIKKRQLPYGFEEPPLKWILPWEKWQPQRSTTPEDFLSSNSSIEFVDVMRNTESTSSIRISVERTSDEEKDGNHGGKEIQCLRQSQESVHSEMKQNGMLHNHNSRPFYNKIYASVFPTSVDSSMICTFSSLVKDEDLKVTNGCYNKLQIDGQDPKKTIHNSEGITLLCSNEIAKNEYRLLHRHSKLMKKHKISTQQQTKCNQKRFLEDIPLDVDDQYRSLKQFENVFDPYTQQCDVVKALRDVIRGVHFPPNALYTDVGVYPIEMVPECRKEEYYLHYGVNDKNMKNKNDAKSKKKRGSSGNNTSMFTLDDYLKPIRNIQDTMRRMSEEGKLSTIIQNLLGAFVDIVPFKTQEIPGTFLNNDSPDGRPRVVEEALKMRKNSRECDIGRESAAEDRGQKHTWCVILIGPVDVKSINIPPEKLHVDFTSGIDANIARRKQNKSKKTDNVNIPKNTESFEESDDDQKTDIYDEECFRLKIEKCKMSLNPLSFTIIPFSSEAAATRAQSALLRAQVAATSEKDSMGEGAMAPVLSKGWDNDKTPQSGYVGGTRSIACTLQDCFKAMIHEDEEREAAFVQEIKGLARGEIGNNKDDTSVKPPYYFTQFLRNDLGANPVIGNRSLVCTKTGVLQLDKLTISTALRWRLYLSNGAPYVSNKIEILNYDDKAEEISNRVVYEKIRVKCYEECGLSESDALAYSQKKPKKSPGWKDKCKQAEKAAKKMIDARRASTEGYREKDLFTVRDIQCSVVGMGNYGFLINSAVIILKRFIRSIIEGYVVIFLKQQVISFP